MKRWPINWIDVDLGDGRGAMCSTWTLAGSYGKVMIGWLDRSRDIKSLGEIGFGGGERDSEYWKSLVYMIVCFYTSGMSRDEYRDYEELWLFKSPIILTSKQSELRGILRAERNLVEKLLVVGGIWSVVEKRQIYLEKEIFWARVTVKLEMLSMWEKWVMRNGSTHV